MLLSIHSIDWLIDSLRIPHRNTRPWWCLWCNFSHNERDTLLIISRWYQIWMIATIIETKTTICLNDAPNYNGLFLPTKKGVLICHRNGWVDLSQKWFGLICQQKWFGLFCQSLVGWAGLGWGWAGAGAIGVISSHFSLISSIKYIRHGRIEDFVWSVELWDVHVKQQQREGT